MNPTTPTGATAGVDLDKLPLADQLAALAQEAENKRQAEENPNLERIHLGMRDAFHIAEQRARRAQPRVAEQADERAILRDLVRLWDSSSVSADDYNEAMCAIESRVRATVRQAAPEAPALNADDRVRLLAWFADYKQLRFVTDEDQALIARLVAAPAPATPAATLEHQANVSRPFAAPAGRVHFDDATIEAAALKHVATDYHRIAHLIPNYRCTEQFARLKAFAEELASRCRAEGGETSTESPDLAPQAATTASASIGDDPKFRDLLHAVQALFIGDDREAKREMIAYIDARAALTRAPLPAQQDGSEDA